MQNVSVGLATMHALYIVRLAHLDQGSTTELHRIVFKISFTVSSLQIEQTCVQNIASVNKPNRIPSKIKNIMHTMAAGALRYVHSTKMAENQ